nr:LysR family transcriptional regulator substrate-binding protein [Neisseria sp. N177_16]
MEIDSVETMLQLVAEGMGYSILSKYSIDLMNYKESIQVIPIESPQFVSRLFLATSAKHALTRTQKEVDKILKRVCLNLVEEVSDGL